MMEKKILIDTADSSKKYARKGGKTHPKLNITNFIAPKLPEASTGENSLTVSVITDE